MPIVSSSYTVGPLEACGRRWVREVHVDDLGALHIREYLSPDQAADRGAILSARAAALSENMAEDEATELTNGA